MYNFRSDWLVPLHDEQQVSSIYSLGRGQESIDYLQQAVALHRELSGDEVELQVVARLEEFLETLGQAERKFGHFEDAIVTFSEIVKLTDRSNDLSLQARAISDIGYTYQQAGERERAIRYLEEAALLAQQAGQTNDAKRWRLQIQMLGNMTNRHEIDESWAENRSQRTDASLAYTQNAEAQQLASIKRYDDALKLAIPVLRWAQHEGDTHLEISVRNTLAGCYLWTERTESAIKEFHKSIRLADGTGESKASMDLRCSLANAYIKDGAINEAQQVLWTGIAYSQIVLEQTQSSEMRQQVVAGSLALYELLAYLASRVDHKKNHETLLTLTEMVRARNLIGWLKLPRFRQRSTNKYEVHY